MMASEAAILDSSLASGEVSSVEFDTIPRVVPPRRALRAPPLSGRRLGLFGAKRSTVQRGEALYAGGASAQLPGALGSLAAAATIRR